MRFIIKPIVISAQNCLWVGQQRMCEVGQCPWSSVLNTIVMICFASILLMSFFGYPILQANTNRVKEG